ncbi:uncharacterized protein LOC105186150 isoform X2 [Harpegnathos saltator]|uniref:uncharacterized protein LOC105186150 isoform X2 n=1 Tax=Harpegnathos saltator TaxID=610380 RepID=UPI000DBEEE76|nr:uncharacterized protein LOC105186150 isoform X2 [Harpegnathos saltator]
MPIAGGILVAGSVTTTTTTTAAVAAAAAAAAAIPCVSSNTGMLRFIDRLSGKRRHVRRSFGPGAGARAVEETQGGGAGGATAAGAAAAVAAAAAGGREANDRGHEVGGVEVEEISSPVARSKFCCDDSGISNKRHYHSSPPHLHHLLHRHNRRQSCRRYHRRTDIDDEDDNSNDDGDDRREDGDNDDDDDDDEDDDNDEGTCLECFHSRLHQRFYDRRSSRSSDVNARLDVENVEVRGAETTSSSSLSSSSTTITTTTTTTTTTVHPLVRTATAARSTATASTTIANPSVVTAMARGCKIPPYLATILILSYTLIGIADACSSRSTPKPRPPTPTDRPNITFHMYTCPPDYAEWYCLNGATCFTVKIVDSLLYNCLCANGYIGQRCEFKDLDGSYLPSRQRVMLETASIAGGATIAVLLVVIICITAYIHCKRKQKELRSSSCIDTVDGPGRDPEVRPFSNRSRPLTIFMAKSLNSSATIEQTRMPGWNCPEAESMRMASIGENKHPSQ